MIGHCKLCGYGKQLCESHIIPKFIFRWLKETSVTSYIRKMSVPGQRLQDGYKTYLLCKDCEDKFSKYEKVFAQNYFYPAVQKPISRVEYGDDLFYFVASVVWRFMLISNDKYKGTPHYETLILAELQYRVFLKNHVYPARFDEMYVLFTGESPQAHLKFRGLNYFFTRTTDTQIIYNDSYCFFYMVIPFFVFCLNIVGLKDSEFENCRIQPSGGFFKVNTMRLSSPQVTSFMQEQLALINRVQLSEKQQQIVEADFVKNLDKARNKQGFRAVLKDYMRDNLEMDDI